MRLRTPSQLEAGWERRQLAGQQAMEAMDKFTSRLTVNPNKFSPPHHRDQPMRLGSKRERVTNFVSTMQVTRSFSARLLSPEPSTNFAWAAESIFVAALKAQLNWHHFDHP